MAQIARVSCCTFVCVALCTITQSPLEAVDFRRPERSVLSSTADVRPEDDLRVPRNHAFRPIEYPRPGKQPEVDDAPPGGIPAFRPRNEGITVSSGNARRFATTLQPLVAPSKANATPARYRTAANVADTPPRRSWKGELIYDEQAGSGESPYHVVDEWGIRHREILPAQGIDLDQFVGQIVLVRDDAGMKLTADQLDFPQPELTPQPEFTKRPAPGRQFARNRQGDSDDFNVRPVQWEMQGDEIVVQPPVVEGATDMNYGGGYPLDGGYVQGPQLGNPAGCSGCQTCGPAATSCTQCSKACGPRGRFWARGEVLLWWPDGMYLPPLLTTSPAGRQSMRPACLVRMRPA